MVKDIFWKEINGFVSRSWDAVREYQHSTGTGLATDASGNLSQEQQNIIDLNGKIGENI